MGTPSIPRPKATPATGDRDEDTHDRVREDSVDKSGKVTRNEVTAPKCD